MFWNPAAAASADGINTVSSYTFAAPDSHLTATGGAFLQEGYNARSGSYSGDFLIPASYANYQLNDRWYLGLALNSPFGFVTKPSNQWAGSPIETTSKVFSVNINPNIAYKITPQLTIGAGIQIEYFKLRENSAGGALPAGGGNFFTWTGRSATLDDWGVGGTAGAIWKPSDLTTIGLGYKSPVELSPSGSCTGSSLTTAQAQGITGLALPSCNGSVSSKLTLPETTTLSGRQQVTESLALLATIEWQHWSRIQPAYGYNSAWPSG